LAAEGHGATTRRNLQLTPKEEADLVSFLQTLTDGYIRLNAVRPDLSSILADLPTPPASGSFVEQLKAGQFIRYFMPTSTKLPNRFTTSTNILTKRVLNLTNR
jgi:hypothetical protein